MKKLTSKLLVFSIAILLFGSGYKLGEYKTATGSINRPSYNILNTRDAVRQEQQNLDFSLFWDTWNTVEQKFVDKKKLDAKKMYYGAIKGLVSSLEDPYTFFLTPEENKQTKDDLGGKFEGIGAQLGLKNNQIVVIAPLKNSPATRAGIRAGDHIVKVNGVSTRGWTLPQAVSKIRGEKGTKVKLTLDRAGRQFEKEIMRDEIHVDSVESKTEKMANCKNNCEHVAYIKVNQFGENTNNEWDRAVSNAASLYRDKEVVGLVLDLRDNPGGFLDGAVYLASEFISEGELIVKQESSDGKSRDYTARGGGKLLDIPLVVLINKGSASASEILSGALRDYDRAELVGEKSFGKGSVQEALDLKGGAGLHVTIAKWILPKGEWINGKGITPETVLENKINEKNTPGRADDAQLDRAIEKLVK